MGRLKKTKKISLCIVLFVCRIWCHSVCLEWNRHQGILVNSKIDLTKEELYVSKIDKSGEGFCCHKDNVQYLSLDSMLNDFFFSHSNIVVDSLYLVRRGNFGAVIGYRYYDIHANQYYHVTTAESQSWWMKDNPTFWDCLISKFGF